VNKELLAMATLAAASVSLINQHILENDDQVARCSEITTSAYSEDDDTSHGFMPKKFSTFKLRNIDAPGFLGSYTTERENKSDTKDAKDDNKYQVLDISKTIVESPDPYPHWTLKECMEQPEAIACVLGFGNRLSMDEIFLSGLDDNTTTMSKIKHLTLSARGTSFNAAKYAEKLMKSLGSFESVNSIDVAEVDENDINSSSKANETGLLVIPESDKDDGSMHQIAQEAAKKKVTVMNIVEVMSKTSGSVDIGVYSLPGQENQVTSTKSFSTQVTVLALVALWFRQMRDKMRGEDTSSKEITELKESLMRLPISFGMAKKARNQCKDIARRLKGKEHCFILGKGFAEPVAMEGALKMKEISKLHAEGYSGGALKHGPFALIENDKGKFGATPIILLILDDNHARHMRTAAEEVKARGADLIIITDNPSLAEGLDSNPLVITSNGPMTALGAILPLQLIAYEVAMLSNINPDISR